MSVKTMAYLVCDWPGCDGEDHEGAQLLRPRTAGEARSGVEGWSRVLGLDFCGDVYGIDDGEELWCAQRVKGEHKPTILFVNAGPRLVGYDAKCRCGWTPDRVIGSRPEAIALWLQHLPSSA